MPVIRSQGPRIGVSRSIGMEIWTGSDAVLAIAVKMRKATFVGKVKLKFKNEGKFKK